PVHRRSDELSPFSEPKPRGIPPSQSKTSNTREPAPTRTPPDSRDTVPGAYPLGDARETTASSSTVEPTAYFTPSVPQSTVALRPTMAPHIYADPSPQPTMATRNTSTNPVLHSCVTEFKSTMHKSVNEMIMTEIVPTLISEVQNHLKNDVTKEVTSMNIKNEIEPLKEFVKGHVETVQDILHVNDSQMQANIEQDKKKAEWELLYPFIEHNIDKT
ncbi:hypothetical protein KEM48_011372, partial [Puccinia striiformis f. sp. tritici PST-130]